MQAATIYLIIEVAFYAAAFACAIHSVMANRTAQGTLAWLLALFALPFAAVPLYLVFGRRRYRAYAAAMRRSQARVAEAEPVSHYLDYDEDKARHLARRLEVAEDIAGLGYTRGNRVELIEDGSATFEAIFASIDAARDYVLVQFYIFRDDRLGRALRDRMTAAAARGVRCHLLYDEVGCFSTPRRYFEGFRQGGVKVRAFGSTRRLRGRFEPNFRNHRKVVVCDGACAFVGGNNVGVEYVGESERFGPWRDAHLRLEGPIVQAIQLGFSQDWEFASGRVLDLAWQPRRAGGDDMVAAYVPTGPADELETGTLLFSAAINTAERRLWIVSPYFVPDVSVMAAMKLAVLRGVEVVVLVPDKPDHRTVWLAGHDFIEEAERAGIVVKRYTAGFLHQKAMLIDDDVAMVGTANMDNRSFRLNFEAMVVVADEAFARRVEAVIEKDLAGARDHTAADYQERSFAFKLAVRGARLLAPVL